MTRVLQRIIYAVFLLACHLASPDASQADEKLIGVLLSREISPYVTMVGSLESHLGNRMIHRFFLDERGRPYSLAHRGIRLNPSRYDVLIAVGPEALRHLQDRVGTTPLVFSMVLNPLKVIDEPSAAQSCGVSLNLPVEEQFAAIRRLLPSLSRLGVLFDPANNQQWYAQAQRAAEAHGLTLIPLQAEREDHRLAIVGDFDRVEGILFTPDKSVISRVAIQYVIKQAFLREIPAIGYNQFFHDSGAALSFVIDYSNVGQQVAELVNSVLAGKPCDKILSPGYEVRINQAVWARLKLEEQTEDGTAVRETAARQEEGGP